MAIPLSEIEEQKLGGSLMPAGLTDTLTRGELADLVRFLSELGKIGPYAVSKDRVFRRWQVLSPGPEATRTLVRTSLDAVVQNPSALVWAPAYTTVAGVLPTGDLPAISRGKSAPPVALAQTQLEVSAAGKVGLGFRRLSGLTLWLDGRRVEPDAGSPSMVVADLKPGVHTLSVALESPRRDEALRLIARGRSRVDGTRPRGSGQVIEAAGDRLPSPGKTPYD